MKEWIGIFTTEEVAGYEIIEGNYLEFTGGIRRDKGTFLEKWFGKGFSNEQEIIDEFQRLAKKDGANAIVSVRIDSSIMQFSNGVVQYKNYYGTAVKLKEK